MGIFAWALTKAALQLISGVATVYFSVRYTRYLRKRDLREQAALKKEAATERRLRDLESVIKHAQRTRILGINTRDE